MTQSLRLTAAVSVAAMALAGAALVATTATTTRSTATPMGQAAAARLLDQATFGATYDTVSSASALTYAQWFKAQAATPPTFTTPYLTGSSGWSSAWWRNSVVAPDQLRQRMAFALSEIFVTAGTPDNVLGVPANQAAYYDILIRDSLGNYRKLLNDVTLSPEMGLYLNMFRNDKPDASVGRHADENYAREVMQLFSVGLVMLNPDGTPMLDANGKTIPTYSQSDVQGLARVFTGWASRPTSDTSDPWLYSADYVHPMAAYNAHHDTGAKTILGGKTIPAHGSARTDLTIALDTIFRHPNVGPFISRQLIQRLVTSNPSPAYVQRVAAIFANNGKGVRGDLLAVAKAILTDPEATATGGSTAGKLREPVVRLTHLWRAFAATDSNGKITDDAIATTAQDIFGQGPLRSPSVFNFFVPDYVRAGPLAKAGLVAPEFQITNENSAILTANTLALRTYQYADSSGTVPYAPQGYTETPPSGMLLHTAAWESLADNPGALIDRMSLVLMAGRMPQAMRDKLVDYIGTIPTTTAGYRGKRVIEAASIIISSPQYAAQY